MAFALDSSDRSAARAAEYKVADVQERKMALASRLAEIGAGGTVPQEMDDPG